MVAYSFDAGSVKSVDGYISEGDTVDVLVSKTDDQGKVKTEIAYKGLKILRVSTNAEILLLLKAERRLLHITLLPLK